MIEIRKPDAALARILPPAKPQEGVEYVPSQFAVSFRHREKQYWFHTLTKQCVEGEIPERCTAGGGYDEWIWAQFLVPEGKDECAYYQQISSLMRAYLGKKGIKGYTILPTFGCNARCVYCYEEGMKPVTMSAETVEQVILFILSTHDNCREDRVNLSWFGGEPLLYPGIINRICEGVREAGFTYRSVMISNGSLITPAIVIKMKETWKLENIQISMDGAEKDYRRRKRYLNYRDTYRFVMAAISEMAQAGIGVRIRCNVDRENWERIPRFLADLSAGISHKDGVGVYFAPLNEVRRGPDDLEMWRKIAVTGKMIEEAGFRAVPFRKINLRFQVNHCMADGGGVVIGPDGSLYPCEHCPPESRYGDIWKSTTDEAARMAFCRVDRTREKCRRCPFLPECTNFASCPVWDTHCRDIQEMITVETLKRMIDHGEPGEEDGEPTC